MPLAVCATPIGNLDDVTLRVLQELGEADLVLCEDTRHTRRLLDRHGLRPRLLSYHEHNEAARTAQLLPRLEAGERIALVSDAGLPVISDPGARLVTAAVAAGVPVTVLPGPSAVETAFVASGLGGDDGYAFIGYLPRGERSLAAVWGDVLSSVRPTIAFESPRRLSATLRSLAHADPDHEVAVCRELTKRHEEVARGPAAELASRFREPPKGEVTLVLAAAPRRGRENRAPEAAARAVRQLVDGGVPRRRAAQIVAELTGAAVKELYDLSL
jgi:16S rRNA (cytidine1402-2'-O)-methyltransferase